MEVFNQEIPWRNSACTGVYTGELSPSLRPQGFGTFTCRSHNYTGDWDRGLRHGGGVNTFSNGDTYTGQWAEDRRHGEGVIRWAGGRVYTGAMAGGRMAGGGEMTWPSGDKYIGDWEADTRTGHGLYLYSSGNRYKGQYLNNKKVVIHYLNYQTYLSDLRRMAMASSGGLQDQTLVTSTSGILRMTRERGPAHITLQMGTFSPGPGSVASRRGRAIRHSPTATCWMEHGEMENDMESSSLYSPMVPDIRLPT